MMGVTQIVILVFGALLFTASFLLPEKKSDTKKSREKEEKLIQETLEKEMEKMLPRIDEAASDAIERTKDVTERYMDKLTNEKMMAVNEYSDTVLEQIHKNHEEAMFLYDMLNNKHAQVKSAAAEVNSTVKNVRQISDQTQKVKEEAKKEKNEKQEVVSNTQTSPDKEPKFEALSAKKVEVIPVQKKESAKSNKEKKKENKTEHTTDGKRTVSAEREVSLSFDTQLGSNNSNDRILELHKAGKSNMAIARELGLGIGEVKLVIDLFRNEE